MKKFISLALIVITIMALCVCASAASPTLKFKLSSNKVAVDEKITVTVTLADCAKVRSIGLTPSYDKSLFTLTKVEWLLKGGIITDFNTKTGDAAIIFDKDTDCNGDIFRFTLKAKKTSVFDLSAITSAIVAKRSDNNIVPVTAKSVNVSVVEPTQSSQTTQTTNPNETTVANTTTTSDTTAPGETTNADTTVDTQNTPTKETTGKTEATKSPDKEETKKVVDGGNITGNSNTTLWIIVIVILIVLAVGIVIYFKAKDMYF